MDAVRYGAAVVVVILVVAACIVAFASAIGNTLNDAGEDLEQASEDVLEEAEEAGATLEDSLTPQATSAIPSPVPTVAFVPPSGGVVAATPDAAQQAVTTPVVVDPAAAQPAVIPNCTLRTDWPLYTVAAGDTLAIIAASTGSTADDLTLANCLADPDTILVGQQIYVPVLPAAAVVPAGQGGGSGYLLSFDPFIGFANNVYTLDGGAAVTITWPNLPPNTVSVEFFYTVANTTTPALITPDLDMTDGAFITWSVPEGAGGVVSATATLSDGTQVLSEPMTIITQ